jgi:branched-chain amino acid transport system permease protein
LAWHHSGTVLLMVILGGMGRLHGPVLGAFGYVLLQELFSAPALLGPYAKHWQLGMGSVIILIVLLLPHGISGLLNSVACHTGTAADEDPGARRP